MGTVEELKRRCLSKIKELNDLEQADRISEEERKRRADEMVEYQKLL